MGSNSIVEDAFDLVLFIVVAGVFLVSSFNIVIPMTKDDKTSESALMDKTTPSEKGYESLSSYDGAMNKWEVVLMTQVQDFDLPEPKKYKAGSFEVPVGSLYEAGEKATGIRVYSAINGSDSNGQGRYILDYNYGTVPNISDDLYIIKKK